jgi:hypothetical protein
VKCHIGQDTRIGSVRQVPAIIPTLPTRHFRLSFRGFILRLCQYRDYIASNGGMIDEGRNGKDMEQSSRGLIAVLYRHSRGGTEESTKYFRPDIRCSAEMRTEHLSNTSLELYCYAGKL